MTFKIKKINKEEKLQAKLILENYFGSIGINDFNIDKIPFGICNETYKVIYKETCFIMQKINTVLASPDLVKDIDFISRKLIDLGWSVPVLLENSNGVNFIREGKNIWRIYSFIPGKTISDFQNIDYISIGELLAKLHTDLRKITYSPLFSIPHFHDTKYFISRLNQVINNFKSGKLTRLANGVIELYGQAKNVSLRSIQLIHGDPRIENYLFNDDGKAFSILDFDTFMVGSIFIDIGDLLRSINLTGNQTVLKFSKDKMRDVLVGYLSVCCEDVKPFVVDALDATKQITLELCSRFLIDIIEDKYFDWDSTRYKCRGENNADRALVHWNLFKEVDKTDLDNLVHSVKINNKFNYQLYAE